MARHWMSLALIAGSLIWAVGARAGQVTAIDLPDATGIVCFGNCQTQDVDLFLFNLGIDPETGDIVPIGNGSFQSADGDQVFLRTTGNVDPVLSLALSVVDNGAPTAFAISVTAPILPAYPAGTMLATMASLSGTLLDADDGDGVVAVSALSASGKLMDTLVNGASVSSIGEPVTRTSVGSGGSLVYGPFSATDSLVCPVAGCDLFSLIISFTGDGDGDRYVMEGRFELSEAQIVPVPGVLLLIGLGLALMPVRGRRG